MDAIKKSPRIVKRSWAEIEVEGSGTFKDVKLFPGGARSWDWSETGTAHSPGIQMADVTELLENNAEVVVLTQGVLGRLKVMPETVAAMEAAGVEVHILKTEKAAALYNQLTETSAVGGLFHSTC